MIIAIDGPAGSGKGTVAEFVAEKLGLTRIDTGAMYRCVALETLREGVSIDNKKKIIEIAKAIEIRFDEKQNVYLNGENVTKEIRSAEVSSTVSSVSPIPEVREEMVKQQRALAKGLNVIMEGRDIGTVVFPNADFKFYLDASLDERARRRLLQNSENNVGMSFEDIRKNLEKRDYDDSHREVGALIRCDDQIYIDSTNMTIEEVVEYILQKVGVRK